MNASGLVSALRLYFVIGSQDAPGGLLETVEAALLGGVTAVQMREKTGSDRTILALAERVHELCIDHDAMFFMNDRLDLAIASGANGVHLGVDDLPIPATRRIAGNRFLIGYSPDSDMGARSARLEGADYLGVGPVFATTSKSDAGPAVGLAMIRRRAEISGLPVVGIGGINASNAGRVVAAGAVGVAVMSAIARADSPKDAAALLREAIDGVS